MLLIICIIFLGWNTIILVIKSFYFKRQRYFGIKYVKKTKQITVINIKLKNENDEK
jgi:hypothetical protein